MKSTTHQIVRVLASLFALADGAWLTMILLWLIGAGGVISCGKGVFDSPAWPLTIFVLVVLPFGFLIGALKVIWVTSRRITLRKPPTAI